jgi:hypothetical protein
MEPETQSTKNNVQRAKMPSTLSDKTERLIEICKEAMALIPGTTHEIQALKRYDSEEMERRFFQAREKLVELLNELTA